MPATGDAGVIRSRMAARMKGQVAKAKKHHRDLEPDFGFRAQVEELLVDPLAVDRFYHQIDQWARDAFPVVDTADEFTTMFSRVLDLELT